MFGDVFDYHNGIVNHHTDGNGEGGEGDDVERAVGKEQIDERGDQGDGDGEGDDDGAAPVAEEYQHDENDEEEGIEDALAKAVDGIDNFFGGIKVDKNTRLKAYESLTKPVYKDKDGNFLTALQKYQRENPADFMKNVALMYSLTDGFKNVDKIVKPGVKAGMKKGFAELESVLNNTRRNSDGTLNLANTSFDDNRENWELAI